MQNEFRVLFIYIFFVCIFERKSRIATMKNKKVYIYSVDIRVAPSENELGITENARACITTTATTTITTSEK